MRRSDARLVHGATALVALTGIAYAALIYLPGPSSPDPFALVENPWQPWGQALHIWTAPLLVFALGVIFNQHIRRHLADPRRPHRRSGWILVITALPMIASGYALQTSTGATSREVWKVLHWVSSGAWVLTHLVHWWRARRRRPTAPRRPGRPVGRPGPPEYARASGQ